MKSVANTVNDPTIAWTTVEVDDVEYRLCYDFNAICLCESLTKGNLLSGMWAFLTDRSGLTAIQLRGLLWAACTKAQPNMTLEDAGNLIRIDTFAPLQEAVNTAYIMSLPKKKRDELLAVAATPTTDDAPAS